jgi:hypothetical protein
MASIHRFKLLRIVQFLAVSRMGFRLGQQVPE